MAKATLYGKSGCTTCRKAKKILEARAAEGSGPAVDVRWYDKQPFSMEELRALFDGREPTEFVNPRSTPFKTLELAGRELGQDEALELLLREPNLMKRPLLVHGAIYIYGCNEKAYQALTV